MATLVEVHRCNRLTAKALSCLIAKAQYLSQIEDKEKAVSAYRVAFDKTGPLGHRIDLVFASIRIGFFFRDNNLISRNIEKAKTYVVSLFRPPMQNVYVWIKYADLERMLGDTERAKGVFEIAVGQEVLQMPEVLWKGYIDFEVGEGEWGRGRELYERLLERTSCDKFTYGVVCLAGDENIAALCGCIAEQAGGRIGNIVVTYEIPSNLQIVFVQIKGVPRRIHYVLTKHKYHHRRGPNSITKMEIDAVDVDFAELVLAPPDRSTMGRRNSITRAFGSIKDSLLGGVKGGLGMLMQDKDPQKDGGGMVGIGDIVHSKQVEEVHANKRDIGLLKVLQAVAAPTTLVIAMDHSTAMSLQQFLLQHDFVVRLCGEDSNNENKESQGRKGKSGKRKGVLDALRHVVVGSFDNAVQHRVSDVAHVVLYHVPKTLADHHSGSVTTLFCEETDGLYASSLMISVVPPCLKPLVEKFEQDADAVKKERRKLKHEEEDRVKAVRKTEESLAEKTCTALSESMDSGEKMFFDHTENCFRTNGNSSNPGATLAARDVIGYIGRIKKAGAEEKGRFERNLREKDVKIHQLSKDLDRVTQKYEDRGRELDQLEPQFIRESFASQERKDREEQKVRADNLEAEKKQQDQRISDLEDEIRRRDQRIKELAQALNFRGLGVGLGVGLGAGVGSGGMDIADLGGFGVGLSGGSGSGGSDGSGGMAMMDVGDTGGESVEMEVDAAPAPPPAVTQAPPAAASSIGVVSKGKGSVDGGGSGGSGGGGSSSGSGAAPNNVFVFGSGAGSSFGGASGSSGLKKG
ncbi:hypothetical protein HDV00_003632 [Rhizophlyctis rosea]|nr:hypothetical protein HDV00_003632 [Rhizophlyctis rosea]